MVTYICRYLFHTLVSLAGIHGILAYIPLGKNDLFLYTSPTLQVYWSTIQIRWGDWKIPYLLQPLRGDKVYHKNSELHMNT